MERAGIGFRMAVGAGAVMAMVVGVWLAVAPYQDLIAFHEAGQCATNDATTTDAGCVTLETGHVVDSNNTLNCVPIVEIGMTCTGERTLTVQRPSGETEIAVGSDVYSAARAGSAVVLQLWHDDITEITVNDETDKWLIPAGWHLGFALIPAWTGLGLLLGSYPFRNRPESSQLRVGEILDWIFDNAKLIFSCPWFGTSVSLFAIIFYLDLAHEMLGIFILSIIMIPVSFFLIIEGLKERVWV